MMKLGPSLANENDTTLLNHLDRFMLNILVFTTDSCIKLFQCLVTTTQLVTLPRDKHIAIGLYNKPNHQSTSSKMSIIFNNTYFTI